MPDDENFNSLKIGTEELELVSLNLVHQVLTERFQDYINTCGQIKFNDLLLILSRQAKGRGIELYHYSIEDTLRSYFDQELDPKKDRELRCRIAACPIFKVALERFVEHSLISWFTSNNIPYENCELPTSADFAVYLRSDALPNIQEKMNKKINLSKINDLQGILLSVDAKSIMGLSNLGDALSRDGILGKFEANWNQISYIPPILRAAMESNDKYYNKKYNTIDPLIDYSEGRFLLISIFVSDLVCLSNMSFFSNPIGDLNSSFFNHYCTIAVIPNRFLQSNFYDSFFNAGKGGSSDDGVNGFPKYPKDIRFQILEPYGKTAEFKNLQDHIPRFLYLNRNGSYKAIINRAGNLHEEEFQIKNFTSLLSLF